MAFTSTVTGNVPNTIGSKRSTWGTYTSDGGSEGGNINTGLSICEFITLTPNSATVETNAPAVNETLPVDGSAVTIATDANESGYWFAFGT